MKELVTRLDIEIDGIDIKYGQIPSGIIEGWDGIVFYFQTNDTFDTVEIELHEKVIGKAINMLIEQTEDYGTYWEKTRIEAVEWTRYCQTTLVSFRVRDSY